MAYISLARPGTPNGPCHNGAGYEKDCAHTDCAQTRATIRQQCPGCRQELGYERPIWEVDGIMQHVGCTRGEKA